MRVAVVGGGAGGLAAAAWVRRALPGWSVRVFDRRRPRSDIGVGVWSNALIALDALDPKLTRELQAAGKWMGAAGYRSSEGSWLATSHLLEGLEAGQPSLLFLPQSKLESVLEDAVGAENIQETTIDSSGVEKLLCDYDIIVGADGRNSTVRRFLVGKQRSHLVKHGYTVFRGNSKLSPSTLSFQTWGKGQCMRFAYVPMKQGSVWFATLENESRTDKAVLLERFKDWHAPICDLISNTDDKEILVEQAEGFTLRNSLLKEAATENRPITLVGDAFHTCDPVLAQGITVAIEDATSLIYHLKKIQSGATSADVTAALRKYERSRDSRITSLYRTSNLVFQLANALDSNVLGHLRDAALFYTPDFVKKPIFDRTMLYSISPPPNTPIF